MSIYIHYGVLFSHKNNEILPFATAWMDVEGVMLNELSQREKDKYHRILLKCENYKRRKKRKTKTLSSQNQKTGSKMGEGSQRVQIPEIQ